MQEEKQGRRRGGGGDREERERGLEAGREGGRRWYSYEGI